MGCKYTLIWFLKIIYKKNFTFLSLILILAKIIFDTSCTWICEKKIFLRELSLPESVWIQCKTLLLATFPWPGTNQKWSKQRIHRYIDCYVLERNEGYHLRKTLAKTLRKGELSRKMEDDLMTVLNWIKVKLLYYCSIK